MTYLECIIPSLDYLALTSIYPIAQDNSFPIEVSNNGKDFSSSGLRFKYINTTQLVVIYPTTGPEIGGTIINITLVDLPIDPYTG